jgi:ATP-dependent DNA helicase 2 subunit 2
VRACSVFLPFSSIEASSCRRGDCIDAILVAMQLLHARVGKKRFQKRIFLVTDAAAPIVDDPAAMEAIADGMRRDEFKLNIIGVGFKEDDDDEEDEAGGVKKEEGDVADMEDEEQKHGEDVKPAAAAAAAAAAGGHGARVKKESLRTATQRANESLLKRFVSSVDGTVFNANSAIEMLSVFRSRSVQQVTKFRGQLHLSSSCAISVWAYTKTQVMNMPTLKKTSKLAGGASAAAASSEFGGGEDEEGGGAAAAAAGGGGWRGGGGDDDDDGGGDGFAAAGGGDGKIAMERSYFNRLGEREKEASADMRIKSYRYGREQIPFSEEDVEQLKLKTEKGIYILSFTPQKAIPRHHYMGGVDWSVFFALLNSCVRACR